MAERPPVRLTALSSDDAQQMNAWQNDAEIRTLLMAFRGPVSIETTNDWIKGLAAQNLKTRVVFGIRTGNQLAGMANLFDLDWLHRNAKFGIFIGNPATRGQGIGYKATSLVLDYGFNDLGLERIWLEVIASNTRAREVYERLGFTMEGALRSAYFADGERHDVAIYGLLAGEWRAKGEVKG